MDRNHIAAIIILVGYFYGFVFLAFLLFAPTKKKDNK